MGGRWERVLQKGVILSRAGLALRVRSGAPLGPTAFEARLQAANDTVRAYLLFLAAKRLGQRDLSPAPPREATLLYIPGNLIPSSQRAY